MKQSNACGTNLRSGISIRGGSDKCKTTKILRRKLNMDSSSKLLELAAEVNDLLWQYNKVNDRRLKKFGGFLSLFKNCLLYTSPSPRDRQKSRMPSSA